jgi:hypothetical protein
VSVWKGDWRLEIGDWRLEIGDWGFRFNGLEENADSLGRSRGKRRGDVRNSACQSEKDA